MSFKSAFKKGFSAGLSPKKWLGLYHLKQNSAVIAGAFKRAFRFLGRPNEKRESFQEAVKRLRLTEQDIKNRMRLSKKLVIIFLVLAGLLLSYSIYQWTLGRVVAGLTCFMLTLLVCAYAFKEHFNLFQMRQRRLGCTYTEWLNDTFHFFK